MKKRYLSGILLALAVLVGLFPTVATAAGPGNEHVLTVDDVEFDVQNRSITRYIGDAEYIKIPEKIGDNRVRQLHVNYGNPSGAFMNAGLKGVAFEAAPEVGSIPLYSFKNNPSLAYAHLPEGIERIEYEAFAECPSLRTVTLPSTLKTIGNYGFHQCKIENLSLPEGLETIGRCAISCVSGDGPNGAVVIPSTMKKLSSAALMMPDEAQTYFFKSPEPLLPFYRFWATADAEGNLIEGTKPLTFLVPAGSKLNYLGRLLAAYPETQTPVRPLNFEEGPDVLLEWYLVTFDGGEGTSAPEEQIVIEGNKALPPAEPTKEGYAFLGWLDDTGELFNFTTEITANTALTAKWAEVHTVTFDTDGGKSTDLGDQIVRDGEYASAPNPPPTKEGHNFLGWYDSTGKAFDFTTEIKADTGLTARWKQVKFSVSGYVWYDDGDGLQSCGDSGGGVPGVYVKIMDADGRRLAWTKTDADGRYALPYFEEGSYTVQFYNIPRGCRIALSYVGDDRTVDSDGLKQKIYLTEDDPYHDLGLLKQSVRSTRRR